jgi:hypothetical protein
MKSKKEKPNQMDLVYCLVLELGVKIVESESKSLTLQCQTLLLGLVFFEHF